MAIIFSVYAATESSTISYSQAQYPPVVADVDPQPLLVASNMTPIAVPPSSSQVLSLMSDLATIVGQLVGKGNGTTAVYTTNTNGSFVEYSLFSRQIDSLINDSSEDRRDLRDSITTEGAFTDPTITGGSLTGTLLADSLFRGDVALDSNFMIGTTTAQELVTIDTGAIYLGSYTPTTTTNRLYSTTGDLYWSGNLLAGGAVGTWGSNGTDVFRLTGNVGIGTSTPGSLLTVAGSSTFTGQMNFSGSAANIALGSNWLSGDGGDEGIFIGANGDVGIGTRTPSINNKLDVLKLVNGSLASSTDGGNAAEFKNIISGGTTAARGMYSGVFVADNSGVNANYYSPVMGTAAETFLGYDVLQRTASNWNGVASNVSGVTGLVLNSTTGSGTAQIAAGLITSVINSGSGSIKNAYGLKIDGVQATGIDPWNNHTAYGVFIGNGITASGGLQNNAYALYSSSTANSFFAGNVGIGTSSPASKLHVVGASGTALNEYTVFAVSSASDDTKRIVMSYSDASDAGVLAAVDAGTLWKNLALNPLGGNVGIGTTTPAYKLHVSGGTFGVDSGSGTDTFRLRDGFITKAAGSGFVFASSLNTITGDVSIPGFTFTQDSNSGMFGLDNDVIGFSTGGIERLRVDASGNVGIGTTSPTARLQVARDFMTFNSEGTAGLTVTNATTPTKILAFGYDTTLDASYIQSIHSGVTTKNLLLNAQGGNIGIGTTTPGYKLDVNGAIRTNDGFRSTVSGIDTILTSDINGSYLASLGANNLRFFTNSIERIRIDSGGNVGIGTTMPNINNKLDILKVSDGSITGSGGNAGEFKNQVTEGAGGGARGIYSGVFVADDSSSGMDYYAGTQAVAAEIFLGYDVLQRKVTNWNGYAQAVSGLSGLVLNFTTGSGTAEIAAGLESKVENNGNGSIRNAYGLKIDGAQATGIDPLNNHNAYGVFIGNAITASGGLQNNAYALYSSSTANSFFAGNVGIGTSAPQYKLVVSDSGNVYSQVVTNTTGTVNEAGLALSRGDQANGFAQLHFQTAENDVWNMGLRAGDNFLHIRGPDGGEAVTIATSSFGIGTTSPAARLSVTGAGTGAGLLAQFTDLANTPRLTILDNGKVGIGTSTPTALLGISGTGQVVAFGDGNGGASTYAGFASGGGFNNGRSFFGYNGISGNAVVQGVLGKGIELNVNNSTFGSSTAMSITSGGLVGIGTTTPGALLTLNKTFTGVTNPYFGVYSDLTAVRDTFGQMRPHLFIGTASSTVVTQQALVNMDVQAVNDMDNGELYSLDGISNNLVIRGSATTTLARGYQIIPLIYSSGNIGRYIGFESRIPLFSGSGQISEAFGMYLDELYSASSTNAYGIYQAGARDKNFFAGDVSIGSTTLITGSSTPLSISYSNDTYKPGLVIKNTGTGPGAISQLQIWNQNGNNGGLAYYADDYFVNAHQNSAFIYSNANIVIQANNVNTYSTSSIKFINAAVIQMVIDSTGNVGIGTTSPTARLSVTGAGTGTGVLAQFADSANTTRLTILDNGNVGIGTSGPAANLHVFTNSGPGTTTEMLRLTPGAGINAAGTASRIAGYSDVMNGAIDFKRFSQGGPSTGITMSTYARADLLTLRDAAVGIGTTTPGSLLTVAGTINSTDLLGGATTLSTDANGNIIRTPSDERLKTDITDVENAMESIMQLQGVRYAWKDKDRFGKQYELGFIAQDVKLVLPELVQTGGEYWTLNIPNMLAVVIEGMKEMWGMITTNNIRDDEQEVEIDILKARIESLEAQLNVSEGAVSVPNVDTSSGSDSESAGNVTPSSADTDEGATPEDTQETVETDDANVTPGAVTDTSLTDTDTTPVEN